jgi:outer membrane receptor protein involved in Fe transport
MLCVALFFVTAGVTAQTVEITATRDLARQLDTAATMVVRREELLRYGDQSVADALKRVPGITVGGVPGRASEIRMRGLGSGYTQLLLNGQPVPAGFSIDTISPELIERVDVMRVAGAEQGAQAIAGTINIVLRKSAPRAQREFKLGLASSNGENTPDLTAQASDKGDGWSYTIGAVAIGSRTLTTERDEELGLDSAGAVKLRRTTRRRQHDIRPSLNLTPRISWTLPNGDTLNAQNFLRAMTLDQPTRSDDSTSIGQPTQFPANEIIFRAHAETVRSDLQWLHPLEAGGRLEVSLGRNHFQRRGSHDFEGLASGSGSMASHKDDSSASEDSITFGGKVSRSFAEHHALVAGWDAARGSRKETRVERAQAGATLPSGPSSGGEIYNARLDRLALFAQDDWSIAPSLSVLAGLRWESLQTRTDGNVLDDVRQKTHVLSPLAQVLYKLSGSQQLRAGVTRTFKMPTLINLAMRRYTVDNNNSPLSAEQQGNPRLLPERAWGLDLAYERYFGKNAMFSVSSYARRIDDVTIDRVAQVGSTWISTPANAGRADTWGVELETKFPIPALALDLRANMARNWSRVHDIAGPDNRLASQVPFSANIGVDHRMATLPLTVGASFGFQGGGPSRLSERMNAWAGVQRDLGVVAVWRVDGRSQWRLSAASLLGQDRLALARYADQQGSLQTMTTASTAATVRLAFEHKLGN